MHIKKFSSFLFQQINTNKVVLASGAWSRDIAKTIGVEIPTMVNKHSYIVSEIIPGISAYPNVRHYDYQLYFKVSICIVLHTLVLVFLLSTTITQYFFGSICNNSVQVTSFDL